MFYTALASSPGEGRGRFPIAHQLNWVKVVQRPPVRPRLIERPGEPPLRAGMTADVSIDTGRSRSLAGIFGNGAAVAARPAPQDAIKTE
jgi:membrane fusion protein, multidrug efflux system